METLSKSAFLSYSLSKARQNYFNIRTFNKILCILKLKWLQNGWRSKFEVRKNFPKQISNHFY